MLEFDSISVSSYEAASLAPQLSEKSAAGWDVVSIVSAGSSVTAYLSRTADSAVSGSGTSETLASDHGGASGYGTDSFGITGATVPPAVEDVAIQQHTYVEEPVVAEAVADAPSMPAEPTSTWSPSAEPARTTDSPSLADDVAVLASQIEYEQASVPSPVEEPAGWGSTVTEPAAPAPAPASEPILPVTTAVPEQPVAPAPEPVVEPVVEPVQNTAAAASAAPAGWYADPSGRFELRYWDGTQWTEHVSRAGQQYTDPPVA